MEYKEGYTIKEYIAVIVAREIRDEDKVVGVGLHSDIIQNGIFLANLTHAPNVVYSIGGPAIYFKKIKGYSEDYTLLGTAVGNGYRSPWSKTSISLGLDPDTISVKAAYASPHTVGYMIIVSVEKTHPGIAHDVASAVRAYKMGGMSFFYVIVCDSDVDPTNMEQVYHAFATKCHPKRGIQVIERAPGMPLNPMLDLHERQYGLGATITFDCTWPFQWEYSMEIPQKVSFDNAFPEEIQQRVLNNWTKVYGLPEI